MARHPAKLGAAKGFAVVALTALTAAAALCLTATAGAQTHRAHAGSNAARSAGSAVVVRTATVAKLGTILVNKAGYTLYMFVPDKTKKVTCDSSCEIYWPVLTAPAHGKAKAEGGAKQSLISSDRNDSGPGGVVTYHGWPLYTFLADSRPGMARGQAQDANGGYWFVMRPDGRPLE